MKTIKNTAGLYFVTKKGFVAKSQAAATKFTNEEVNSVMDCIESAGVMGPFTTEDVKVESDPNIVQNADGSSFAVAFVRPKQIRADLSINTHKLNPSKRRFKTEDEAIHHARRFTRIEKHAGYFILPRKNEAVNAYVNKVTGKTNPVVGKGRENRD